MQDSPRFARNLEPRRRRRLLQNGNGEGGGMSQWKAARVIFRGSLTNLSRSQRTFLLLLEGAPSLTTMLLQHSFLPSFLPLSVALASVKISDEKRQQLDVDGEEEEETTE